MELPLTAFAPITLDEMNGIRLMSRIDTKYVIHNTMLPSLLDMLDMEYYIQDIAGKRSFEYLTLYYDTRDYTMYHTHQNGKLNRYKIRTREYCDSQICFLEIKYKSNKGLTQKIRVENNDLHSIEQQNSGAFINRNSPYHISMLEAKLKTHYRRITLVNKDKTERLTIDYNLQFENIDTGKKVELPGLTIIEIKKGHFTSSPFAAKMSELHIKPYSLSKYCLGTALTDTHVKQNNIKRKLFFINKLTEFDYV